MVQLLKFGPLGGWQKQEARFCRGGSRQVCTVPCDFGSAESLGPGAHPKGVVTRLVLPAWAWVRAALSVDDGRFGEETASSYGVALETKRSRLVSRRSRRPRRPPSRRLAKRSALCGQRPRQTRTNQAFKRLTFSH